MDIHQFHQHIVTHIDKLYRLALYILQDRETAHDMVQELNLKLWEQRKKLTKVENIPAFAMRVMRNLCLDKLRTTRKLEELSEYSEYQMPNPYLQIEQKNMVEHAKNLINKLPELQRTIMQMRDVDGMEISEIAYITSLSENAVSVNLSRARQKVREQLLKEQKTVEDKIWTK